VVLGVVGFLTRFSAGLCDTNCPSDGAVARSDVFVPLGGALVAIAIVVLALERLTRDRNQLPPPE
jgi:hypothetical protein